MRMLRQRRELAGNICLVVFAAFLFMVVFGGIGASAAEASPSVTWTPDQSAGTSSSNPASITDDKLHFTISPITSEDFSTIFAQIKLGNTVLKTVYANDFTIESTVYEQTYQQVYKVAYDISQIPGFAVNTVYEIAFTIDGVVYDSVYVKKVYQPPEPPPDDIDDGGGGGGGGGGAVVEQPATPTPSEDGSVDLSGAVETKTTTTASGGKAVEVTIKPQELAKAIEAASANQVFKVEVREVVAEAKVNAPGDGFVAMAEKGATLQVASSVAKINIPAAVIPVAQIAKELGVQAKDVVVEVKMAKADAAVTAQIKSAAESNQQVIGEPIEFAITLKAAGTQREIKSFGSTYVSREVALPPSVNTNKTTAVVWENGVMRPVPTLFTRDAGGKVKAVIMSRTNSVYAFVQTDKTFVDVEKHWSKEFVNILASKLIIEGKTKDAFAPNDQITRAEFATLLVKALGLPAGGKADFTDVPSSAWYAGYVGAAVEAGIVSGYTDNTFKPNANISRQDMAVMISNALAAAGKAEKVTAVDSKLAKFADSAQIASYAKESVAKAVQAGIITGRSADSFAPKANATRAEGATMIRHMLVRAGLMQ